MSPPSAPSSNTLRIAVICHGNIARSQTLHHYLTRELAQLQIPADIFSCGTATSQSYSQDKELLAEVQQNLTARGLDVIVERTCWSDQATQRVADSDIVLVADRNRRAEVLKRTGMPPERVHLFYEFIDEGPKDFTDTFDRKTGKQDPTRFAQCFDELQRIAELTADRIKTHLAP